MAVETVENSRTPCIYKGFRLPTPVWKTAPVFHPFHRAPVFHRSPQTFPGKQVENCRNACIQQGLRRLSFAHLPSYFSTSCGKVSDE